MYHQGILYAFVLLAGCTIVQSDQVVILMKHVCQTTNGQDVYSAAAAEYGRKFLD